MTHLLSTTQVATDRVFPVADQPKGLGHRCARSGLVPAISTRDMPLCARGLGSILRAPMRFDAREAFVVHEDIPTVCARLIRSVDRVRLQTQPKPMEVDDEREDSQAS